MTAASTNLPQAMAAEMRRKAEAADGAERDYFAWLAAEWDRTAERERSSAHGRSNVEAQLARA